MTTAATTRREDLVTVLAGCWLLAGAGLDGHAHIGRELESFFTPWHAVLYSGFAATLGWITVITLRRGRFGIPTMRQIPGYGLAWVGIAMFAVGGAGDLAWHQVFGIEQGIEATFSPTHVLLLFGASLFLTSPARAAWMTSTAARPPATVVGAATLAATLVALAMTYFSPFVFQSPFFTGWQQPMATEQEQLGLGSLLLTNVIMVAPPLALMTRWKPGVGTFVVIWGVQVLAVVVTNEATDYPMIIGVVGAALAADVLALALRTASMSARLRIIGAAAPMFLWAAFFATIEATLEVGWEPELWAGAIVWASVMGLGIAQLLLLGARDQARAAGMLPMRPD